MRSMVARVLASWLSEDMVGCKMRDVAMLLYREIGEDGVENSGEVDWNVLSIVPWHGRTTPICVLGV